jgi:integrase
MKLSAKTIASLTLPAAKNDVIHFDDDLAGFGLRLRRGSGGVTKSWVAQYRRAGAGRRVLLGSAAVLGAEQARQAAKKVLAAVALGHDPQADRVDRRAKDQLSLRNVIDEYLVAKKPQLRPRSFIEVNRHLKGPAFKPLHSTPVDSVLRKDIAARLVIVARESGSVTAARARASLNAFFTWCLQMGMVESNPVIGTIKPVDSKPRERVLTDDELAAIWRACRDDDFGRIIKLLILTGARRGEVGGMKWDELDEAAGTWTIPAARSKNGQAHTLALPQQFWEIIRSVPRRASRDHLFGAYGKAGSGFTHWMVKPALDARLGDSVEPWTIHDLRRTVATRMAEDLAVQPHIVEQVLNHQRSGHKSGVAGTYNRAVYAREVKAALALWAARVRSLVDGGERKVVPFPAPSAAS